jgi:hypothetical protein
MPRIKGSLLRGALKFIKHAQVPGGIPAVLATLPPGPAATFASPLLASEWYPYDAYRELLRAIDATAGRGDLAAMATLGRFTARQDLAGVFRVISVLASIPRILQSSSIFWSRYCDAGAFEILDLADDRGTGRITGFPEIAPEHEAMLVGWIEGMGLAAGARTANVELACSVHRGDPHTEYRMRWSS